MPLLVFFSANLLKSVAYSRCDFVEFAWAFNVASLKLLKSLDFTYLFSLKLNACKM